MRILFCSLEGDGVWFAWLLRHNGHEVDWTAARPEGETALKGLMPPPKKNPNARAYDLIVFDSTEMGDAADSAKTQGIPIIGDSSFCDKMEDDRLYGIEMMEKYGIRVPTWEPFNNPSKAIDWLRKTHKRCVLKPIGDISDKALTYVGKNEADMIRFIETRLPGSGVKEFLLQEFVKGTEISTEAWWTGSEWVALNHDLEEKKLMSGGVGPATGCSGNVIWMPTRPTPIFQQGLEKIAPLLIEHDFRGLIDLNAIVTEGTLFGLEWTPRFGYEGTCNMTKLLPVEFGEFLHAVATDSKNVLSNLEAQHKFVATVRIAVPPYPSALKKAPRLAAHVPIQGLEEKDYPNIFLADVNLEDGELVAVEDGMLGAPLGCGESIEEAFKHCQMMIDKMDVPDLMYRDDLSKVISKRYNTLQQQGWLRQIG
jgi:phosphoribosylamine-glycine ligase